jgi:23S rRNA (guanine2445-N2)-methyltransferase / 23S rRNA (guanine2069-N7)-methyltransferase
MAIEVPSCAIEVADPNTGAAISLPVWEANTQQFAARLRKVAKERRKWARKQGISCYRVYDADLPDYCVAIDVYEGAGPSAGMRFAVMAEYRAPSDVDPVRAAHRFADALAVAGIVLDVSDEHLFARQRRRDKGGSQYSSEHRGTYRAFTQEDGYQVELDFGGYLDTGIFLDHRTTRQMLERMAHGKRFLNLFAYTGVATLHAAGGGARTTTTVDLSQTYLDRAERNMAANGFTGAAHRFIKADVTEWVVRDAEGGHRYELIFVDPPTFSNSKSMGERTWDVQRDHAKLLVQVAELLAHDGAIVFSCNLRDFKIDEAALCAAGLIVEDISAQTIPHDFERNPRIHRCYTIRSAR